MAADLAAVAEAARAAAVTAGLGIEIHSGVAPPGVAAVSERADRLTASIREAVPAVSRG